MMPVLIGIDVGSSDCKVIAVDDRGTVLGSASHSYPTYYPQPGWAEQDAEAWYHAACSSVKACIERGQINPRQVVGIAVDGPAHNVALLDSRDAPVSSVIHWSDLRSTPQAERLETSHGAHIFDVCYSRVNPSWTLTQILWLKEMQPAVWQRVRRILVTKDYVRYRLTGQYCTDPYDAIGTQLYDVAARCWSAELCALIDLDPDLLPPVMMPFVSGGMLQPQPAQDMGLTAGIPVAVGSGDSVVEAMGIGALRPGQCLVKLGTAANVNLVTSEPRPSAHSITYPHVVQPHWFTITATNSGTATLRWFRDTFCREEVERAAQDGTSAYALIDALAAESPPGASGLIFHPYLMGERSPYWDPRLRGDFVGISAQHQRRHFARAVLEGVAFSLRDCLHIIETLGEPIREVFVLGGGARSTLWRQMLCDVLGQPLHKPALESAALGSAIVAGLMAGVFPDVDTALTACAGSGTTVLPDPVLKPLYDAYFAVYRDITRDLARHSHQLAALATDARRVTT